MATDKPTDLPRPTVRELSADEIDWTLRAAPPIAIGDLLDMVVEALIDAESYRVLAQEAIHFSRRLTITCDQLRENIRRLRLLTQEQCGGRDDAGR